MPDDDEVREPVYDELHKYWDLIGRTPARTAAGAREQVLRAIQIQELGCVQGDPELAGLRHAAATLERLAAAGGT
jgi:hypothetical protein